MSEMAWVFKLVDEMSAPARRMSAALGGVDTALHRIGRATVPRFVPGTLPSPAAVGSRPSRKPGEGLEHARKAIDKLRTDFAALGGAGGAVFAALDVGLKKVMRRDVLASQLRGLRALRGEFKAVGNAAGVGRVDAFTAALRRQNHATGALSRGLGTLRLRYAAAGGGISGFRSALNGLSGPLGKSISGTAALGVAALAGTAALAGAGFAAHYVASMQKVKESAGLTFRTFLGTSEQSSAMYKNVLDAAKVFGTKPSEALGSFQTLISKGFSADVSFKIFQGMADLSAISPDANIEALTRAMGQIKGKGKLLMEELSTQMGDAGLPLGQVLEQLANITKVGGATLAERVGNVSKMITAGQIDADTGVRGILATIQKMGGGKALGTLGAEKASTTLDGLVGKLKALPEQYILRLQTSGSFAKVTAGLDGFLKMFDPSTGLGKGITAALEALVSLGVEMGGGFMDGLGQVLGPLKDLMAMSGSGAGGPITALAKGFRYIASGMGRLVGFFVMGVGAIAAVAGALGWVSAKLLELGVSAATGVLEFFDWLGSLGPRSRAYCAELGASLVDGLWAGIKSGWSWLLEKFTGLIELLPASVRKVLGIASPSRVMAKLGAHTTQGFALGLTSVDVAPAWHRALGAPKVPTASVVGARALAAGGGASRNLSVGDVVVHVSGQAAETAEGIAHAVRRMFLTELGPALDQLAVEGGAF